jgi:AraC family transcriptional regulator, regulatory protein of adaptative response / methylated-DNA-[protein]-cysteine methyltransferase
MVARADAHPSLEQVASHVGVSPTHFQRVFVAMAGVSPKEFQQAMTLDRAKELLAQRYTTLETTMELGLSSPSRLNELFTSIEKISPGEYQREGAGLTVRWDVFDTPLGRAVAGIVDLGLCHLGFVDGSDDPIDSLHRGWGRARLARDRAAVSPYASEIQRRLSGRGVERRIGLLLKGTDFRIKVWEALLKLPDGVCITYGELAAAIGQARAVRAVATSVATNDIAVLIPCHRVIRSSGALGEYRWGETRKRALLALELARPPALRAA